MKEQYVGDISDYRKYALLRVLASGGQNRIGVCWMLTPSDHPSDGKLRQYLEKPEVHRGFDPELFDHLRQASGEPDRRRLHTIEEGGTVPGATYFNEPLPIKIPGRTAFMAACQAAFRDIDLVFFDPDVGLAPKPKTKGLTKGLNYVFEDEIAPFFAGGASVLVYQHWQHKVWDVQIEENVSQLRRAAPGAEVWVYRTSNVAFLLALHPSSSAALRRAAERASSDWPPGFIRGTRISALDATISDPE
jgi:hypothetical protein